MFRSVKSHGKTKLGLRWIIPFTDRVMKVSMRTVILPPQSQKLITNANVSIGIAYVA